MSTETNGNNLSELAERLREDKNILKPLKQDYLLAGIGMRTRMTSLRVT